MITKAWNHQPSVWSRCIFYPSQYLLCDIFKMLNDSVFDFCPPLQVNISIVPFLYWDQKPIM